MANTWFRLYHEFSTDPKIQMMPESYQRRFIMLLCLKSCNGDVTLQDEEVAFQLRISNDEWLETKAVFIAKNLIDNSNNPIAWDKRQFVSDSSAERVAKHRERKKRECNVTVTPPDTDTDTDSIDTNVSIVGNEKKIPDCPHQQIIDLYKKNCPEAIHPRTWDGARAIALKARWREGKGRQNLEWWDKFFSYISESDFLMGRVQALNRRPFELSLDWIVTKSNFDKIIDGKYENKRCVNQ